MGKRSILLVLSLLTMASCSNVKNSENSSKEVSENGTSISESSSSSEEVSSVTPSYSSEEISSVILSTNKESSSEVSSSSISSIYHENNDTTYYDNVDTSLDGEEFMKSIYNVISKNTVDVTYKGAWTAFKTTDIKPGTNNIIYDMYSNCEYECGGSKQGANYKKEGDSYNREHTIPQSWFNEASPMKADLFHLYPTDGYVNNIRSNYPHGNVKSASKTTGNGSKLGTCASKYYSGTVFEVIDEYKGDFARSYLYFAVRYMNKVGSWGSGADVVFKGSFPYLTDFAIDTYISWCKLDPVSEKEISRNEAVYKLQKNRNPFIDHESWIYKIWDTSYYSQIIG
jgi:endonuclease I